MGTVTGTSFKKGRKPGPGRPKGLPNKTTQAAREAIAKFVDGNADRLQTWLDQVAHGVKDEDNNYVVAPNPEKAYQLFQSVIEYHVPKLNRSETHVTGTVSLVDQLKQLDEFD
jgi:hypothetical protein